VRTFIELCFVVAVGDCSSVDVFFLNGDESVFFMTLWFFSSSSRGGNAVVSFIKINVY
jgi:hypothetical protein